MHFERIDLFFNFKNLKSSFCLYRGISSQGLITELEIKSNISSTH